MGDTIIGGLVRMGCDGRGWGDGGLKGLDGGIIAGPLGKPWGSAGGYR